MASYNLDDGVQEYFDFNILGYDYRFRQPNTEELEKLSKIVDRAEANDYLFSFIDPVGEKTPKFGKVSKKMLAPHWAKFNEMVSYELKLDVSIVKNNANIQGK